MTQKTFNTHRGPVIAAAIAIAFLVGLSIYVVSLIFRFDGNLGPNPPFVFLAFFYGLLATGVVLPLLRAWFVWRKLPKNPLEGRLILDEAGLTFDLDRVRHTFSWVDVRDVHPVSKPQSNRFVLGLLLNIADAEPLDPRAARRVLRRLAKQWSRPIDVPSGVVIPLAMFHRDETSKILELAKKLHAAAKKKENP